MSSRHPFLQNAFLLPVYVPTMILALAMGLLVPIMPLYARSFGISYGLVGVVLASRGIGNLIGDLPAGMLLGRIGQKWSMLVGIGTLGLSMLAMSWAQSVPELIAYGMIAGVGNAMWNISRHAYLTSITAVSERGRANSMFGGINRIGKFIGPVIGGLIAAQFGLRVPYIAFALLAAGAFVVSAIFVEDLEEEWQPAKGGLQGHTRHLWTVIRDNFNILSRAGTGQLLGQMIRSGRDVLIPLYAADIIGLDVDEIAYIVALSSAIDMAGFYPAGLIMDRFGRKFAYVPCFTIQAIGMALVPFTDSFATMLAATLVIGFGNGLGSGAMLTLGSDLAPKESMGEFLGVWRLIGDSGQSGAPLVIGGVAEIVGLSLATFVIAGVGLGAALVLGLLVPETLKSAVSIAKPQTPEKIIP